MWIVCICINDNLNLGLSNIISQRVNQPKQDNGVHAETADSRTIWGKSTYKLEQ